MANLRNIMKRVVDSNFRHKRFYSSRDMAEIKHYEAIRNSQEKRGEIKREPNQYIVLCGCGVEGCFVHGDFKTTTQEEFNQFKERSHNTKLEDEEQYKKYKSSQGKKSRKESKKNKILNDIMNW